MNSETAPILSHLQALRRAIFVCAEAVLVSFAAVWGFAADILVGWIVSPIKAKGIEIIYTAMSEAFITKIKVSFIASVIIASPVIIWQLWSFIRPEL